MNVLIDSNFIVDCARFRIDFSEELGRLEEEEGKIDAHIPAYCIDEIKKIRKRDAQVALKLLEDPRIKVLDIEKTSSGTDMSLLDYAKAHGYAVATNDRELIGKLRKENIKAIRIRQRKYFKIV